MITKGSVTSLFDSWIKNKAVIKDIIGKIGEFKYDLCMLINIVLELNFFGVRMVWLFGDCFVHRR